MKYVFALFSVLFFSITDAQIIDQIKDASDRHTEQSSGDAYSSDDYSDNSDDDDYNSNDDSYYNDYSDAQTYNSPSPLFEPDPSYWLERKRADSMYKFSALNLLYRQTVSTGQVTASIPELQFKLGGYYGSFRVNTLIEEGAKKEDQFQTIDLQFFGFQTNPMSLVVFNLSMGVLGEQYSGKTFIEGVVGFRVQPSRHFALSWEGRLAGDEIVMVRSEGTISVDITLFRNKDIAFTTTVFGTSATYYETVDVMGFGFGAGLRF
ncbi:MAG: hypothetical protein ACI8SE_000292 [Bacteroidia bacterium]|jgi:hypothetical protein